MKFNLENDVLTIYLEGNVDSNNAESIGNEIDVIRNDNKASNLVLDLEELKYISSAGLRQILRLKKIESNFKVINCNNDIYDIFEMTGFSEMMDIEKGYRKFSVDGCEVIGEGSNGIVYRLSGDTIIKVYKNNDALEDIKRERELAKTALVLGINTAIPFDVVKVDGKFGSMFEMLSAKSITKLINSDPDNKDNYLHIFINLLKDIHNTPVKAGLLPDAKLRAIGWANDLKGVISDDKFEKLFKMLNEVPDSLNMIHGDYHTNNVHYDGKEPILIDMDTLSVGNPVFELSNFFLAYQGFGEIDHSQTEKFLKIDWDTCTYIFNKGMEFYFDNDKEKVETNKHKAYVVGYTRLLRRTLRRNKDNTQLIEHCKKRLEEEIGIVKDLVI